MGLYFKRALRYLIKMVVILALALVALVAVNQSNVNSMPELAGVLFTTWRGWLLIGVLVILTALYPKLAFGSVYVECDFTKDREAIINGFASIDYSLTCEGDGIMRFRPTSGLRRLLDGYNDEITVTRGEGDIEVEGIRKIVLRMDGRIRSQMTV